DRKVRAELAKLSAADRRLAESQKFCPVLRKSRLGSMGRPVKLLLDGQPVFLCCASCEEKAKADPKKTLGIVADLKKGALPGLTPPGSPPASEPAEERQIRANLAKLSAADRRLAEEQKFCPVTGERLGDPSMGVPVKVTVKGQTVFLCCAGCRQEALDHPDRILAKVRQLKAKGKAGRH